MNASGKKYFDPGYFYAPYIPITQTPIVMMPSSPVIMSPIMNDDKADIQCTKKPQKTYRSIDDPWERPEQF